MDKTVKGQKWFKLSNKSTTMRFNQKKFVKRFVRYNKETSPTNSTDEFDYFASTPTPTLTDSFDWRKKTREEIEDMKKEIQWKAFERIENFELVNRPEISKLFRGNKTREPEVGDPNEMWTLAQREPRQESCDESTPDDEKTTWKISRMSLPVTMNEKTGQFKMQNQNLLWRSLEHIQQLYEDEHLQELSEVISVQFENGISETGLEMTSSCCVEKSRPGDIGAGNIRKARLSRWNFLRYDNSQRKSPRMKTSYSKLFTRNNNKKMSKREQRSPADDRHPRKEHFDECSSNTEDSCTCSCCSCDTCTNSSTENSTGDARQTASNEEMAPNSEEDFQSKRAWGMDFVEKEPLRPPVYNPEDYAISLKKWGRKTNSGMQLPLYLSQSTGSIEKLSSDGSLHDRGHSTSSTKSSSSTKTSDEKHSKKEKDFTLKMEKKELKNKENVLHRGTKNDLNVDFRNPILTLTNQEGEMSLRQFSSVTELLGKLKVDLQLSFPSFVQEFVGDPVDGVTLLLELLRAVQLSQASQQQKRPPQIFRRALLDEHSCLICLKHCLRCSDATRRLVSSPAGLFTLAVCIMSNVTQSRIIALELLTKACEIPGSGHKAVSEALSTLRLRFGEPVRFRFLVGMLNSAGTIELLATAMKFINVFVETASNIQQKVYIQAELEQAGFDAKTLRKTLPCNSESVKLELNKWEKSYFDVETLQNNVVEVNSLHEKIELLEKRIEILQEEKGILQSLEQCLKERCSELEEEPNKRSTEKGESTPAEDEGISSSEQELSQDEDYVKTDIPYNTNTNEFGQTANSTMKTLTLTKDRCKSSNKSQENNAQACCNLKNYKNTRSSKMTETNVDDGNEIIRNEGESNEEEETTIDEVIEELENIVNNAETQAYAIEEKKYKLQSAVPVRVRQETATDDKARIYASQEKDAFEETEIVPSLLHPQPPRKAKSLVHIYFSGRDFDSQENTKNEFFDEDTDTESSDSLLTATREKRSMNRNYNRSLNITDSFGSFSSNNTRTLFIKNDDEYVDNEMNIKQCFEERNIDEEEIKRKQTNGNIHYKDEKIRTENFTSPIFFKDNRFGGDTKKPVFQKDFISERITMRGSMDRLNEKGYTNCYEKTTYFHGIKPCKGEQSGNDVLTGRMQKYPPAPVKRSQTFHITSDSDTMYKRSEMKPKPKMGVSGLDFQRNTEQKIKSDHGKYQSIEYRKNFERKPDASDRYSRRMSKDSQKYHPNETQQGTDLYRRGSFDGVFSLTEVTENRVMRMENSSVPGYQNESSVEKPCAKIRSKSLEKMDEGLDSLVDIVIATDECKKPKPRTESTQDVGKNIGPRTRRSLAESSLFSPPRERLLMKPEETPKPPKPAQRTSLTRHNSSSNTHHVPGEVKLAPVQPNPRQQIVYNFGMKSSKSEDSLFSGIKRCPPDGSSSPMEFKAKTESQISSDDASTSSPLYSTAVKPPKTFGNSKFDYGRGEVSSNQTYFGSDYSEGTLSTGKPVSPMPRNIQNGSGLNVKSFGSNSTEYKPVPTKSTGSKPNFLLGTYQSQATKNIPKPSSSVLNSINTFNNSILVKKPTGNTKIYASPRVNGSGFSSSVQKGHNPDGANRKSNAGNGSMAEKVTDSPSGLY